jgi:hypothetical protein
VLRDRPPQLLESIDLLRIFLEACDLAKFSTLSLPKADLASLDQIARRLVLETARPATPNAEAPAGSPPARPTPTAEPTLARQS